MKIWLAVLVMVVAGAALADAVEDSLALESALQGLEGPARIEHLQAVIRGVMRNDPSLAQMYARRALAEATRLGDEAGRFQAHMDMGVALYYQGRYKLALRQYEAALQISLTLEDPRNEADVRNNIGILYFVWGEHNIALEDYLKVLAIYLELEDKGGAARAYNNIAAVHHTAKRFGSALEYYHQALELYRERGDLTFAASTLNNIGLVEHDLGNQDSALAALEEALRMERQIGDRSGESLSLNNMGLVRAAQQRFQEADRLYSQALEIRREIEDRQGEGVTLQLKGKALVQQDDMEQGLFLLEAALEIFEELEIPELIRDVLLDLSESWSAAGRYDLALEYARRHKEVHDRLFDEQRARQMAAAEARFELDLKDQEIAGLRREAEFEAFRRNLMFMVAGLLLIIILLLWNRYRFQKRSNTEIQAKNQALSAAHAELEQAARSELAHVARVATMGELTAAFAHELNQPLTAIKANVRAARNLRGLEPADEDEVDEALQDIRDDAERAREIIQRLRDMMRKGEERREPCDLNEVITAVMKMIEPTAGAQGVALDATLGRGLPPVLADRIQLQQVILNLVQNSLAAMAEERGSVKIDSTLVDEGCVGVKIVDEGPPVKPAVLADMFTPFFTTKPEGLGMGLPICRTIIEAHGGKMAARANPDRGLTVEFTLPRPRDEES